MIKSLMIKNFAIIDQVNIDFSSGMTVFTGETGAGKSIIIDAIGQLLGERANAGLIKSGKEKAFIEAVIDVSNNSSIKEQLEDLDFEVEDDIVVSKEITKEGKSTCKINYRSVNMTMLKDIMEQLVDIHSQFETQYLLNEKVHIHLLDSYAKDDINNLLDSYKDNYKEYSVLRKELDTTLTTVLDVEQLEFYQNQLSEIEKADITENEIENLEKEKKTLQNFEKINEKMQIIYQLMMEDEGILPKLFTVLKSFDPLTNDDLFNEVYSEINDGYYKIEDAYERAADYFKSLDFDEYRLNDIQERIYFIQKIQRKYGYTNEDIQEYKENIIKNIELIENRDFVISQLEKKIEIAQKKCMELAKAIHNIRKKKAIDLQKIIEKELGNLYMSSTTFIIDIKEREKLNSLGIDDVVFLISTNVGQDVRALNKVASGGELSRIMLVLKTVFTRLNSMPTIIFDEVDTGVSGKVAEGIGLKMKEISKFSQVLCITHLPQVASFGDNHLYIFKDITKSETYTKVNWLIGEERVYEIAKMLSGQNVSDEALQNAKHLIELSANK